VSKLLAHFRPQIKTHCRRAFAVGLDSDDLEQIGMEGAVKGILAYDPDRGGLKTIVHIAVRRNIYTAINFASAKKFAPLNESLRTSRRTRLEDEEDGDRPILDDVAAPGPSAEHALIEREERAALIARVRLSLSPMELAVFDAYFEADGGYADVAAIVGTTPKSVDNTLGRIRAKFRAIVAEGLQEEAPRIVS